jgi:hypothetical protein
MANGKRIIYRFCDDEITAPANMTVEEVRNTWASIHPVLENADVVERSDGSIRFIYDFGGKLEYEEFKMRGRKANEL